MDLWRPPLGGALDEPRREQEPQALERGVAQLRGLVVAGQAERPRRDLHQLGAHRAGLGAGLGELLKVVARLAQRGFADGEHVGEGADRGRLGVDAGDARGDEDSEHLGPVELGLRIRGAHADLPPKGKVPSFSLERSLRSACAVRARSVLDGRAPGSRDAAPRPPRRSGSRETRALKRGRASRGARRLPM